MAENLMPGSRIMHRVVASCRALNQAIGRCIRHKNDYGAIVLLDCRFHNPATHRQLSRWCAAVAMLFLYISCISADTIAGSPAEGQCSMHAVPSLYNRKYVRDT